MDNPSIIPAIGDLLSEMTLMMYALNKDTYVEASVVPRSQLDAIVVGRIGCLIERSKQAKDYNSLYKPLYLGDVTFASEKRICCICGRWAAALAKAALDPFVRACSIW